jgi:hypothetical protein
LSGEEAEVEAEVEAEAAAEVGSLHLVRSIRHLLKWELDRYVDW